jgi:hypothetical protein
MTPLIRFSRPASAAFAKAALALLLLGGCAASSADPVASYISHNNPAVRSQLQAATDRYFACVYRAVDNNIRFAPADETRTVMEAAINDCHDALRRLSTDVAQLKIRSDVARDLIGSAERHGYAIAREGLRRYFDNGGVK